MRIRGASLAIVVLFSIVVTACTGSSKPRLAPTPAGQVIPIAQRGSLGTLSGSQFDGSPLTSDGDRGSVVLLNWFASWCAPCQVETPGLVALEKQLRPSGVKFIGVDAKDAHGAGQEFVHDEGIGYPVLFDEPGAAVLKLATTVPTANMPFSLLVDKKGRIAAFYDGKVLPPDAQKAIATLQAEQ